METSIHRFGDSQHDAGQCRGVSPDLDEEDAGLQLNRTGRIRDDRSCVRY